MRPFVTTLAGLLLLTTAPRAERDYHAHMYQGIQGHWKESDQDVWWDIAPDLVQKTDRDGRVQRYVGFRLNADVSPAWLDLLYKEDGQLKMALGIAYWQPGRLTWAEGEHVDARRWAAAGGDLPGRPRDFKSAKATHILVRPGPRGVNPRR